MTLLDKVLKYVLHNPGTTAWAVSEAMNLRYATTCSYLAKLRDEGYITKGEKVHSGPTKWPVCVWWPV